MKYRLKVLFLVNSLGGGGAEKVLVNLVNHMDKTLFDITVRTMFSDGVNLQFLNSDIRHDTKRAPSFRGVSRLIKLIPVKMLYKYFVGDEKFDVIIAYMHGAPTRVIVGRPNTGPKTIAWLHCGDMKSCSLFSFFSGLPSAISYFERLDAIVCVSKVARNSFSAITGITDRLFVKYNTNDVEKIKEMALEPIILPYAEMKRPIVCAVGRFTREKGFERLIGAFERLYGEHINFTLLILGDGPLFAHITGLIEEKKLTHRINLLGFKTNPYPYIAISDLLICSSYYEGLSTVVSEALILGVPVVSTLVSGAEELLGPNNDYGIITENTEEGLYMGLKDMFMKLEYYKHKAKERTIFFGTEQTVKAVEQLIVDVYKG